MYLQVGLGISRLYPAHVISFLQDVFKNESIYNEAISNTLHVEDFADV